MRRFKWSIPPTEDEVYIKSIVDRCLAKHEVKKLMTPVSRICYLYDKDEDIKVRLKNFNIDIFQGGFPYRRELSGKFSSSIEKAIVTKIEEELNDVNKEFEAIELDYLRKILKEEV